MPTTAINYDGVPTDTDMQATLLPDPEQMYVFRNLFRVDEEAPNRDGDTVEYPSLDGDFEGELVEIADDEEHPEAKLTYDGLQAAWTEYGFKFRIRDKDIQDSKINLVVVNQQEATREEMRRLDGIAGAVIENNRNDVEIGDAANSFNYNAAVDMETKLIDHGYEPSRFMFVLSPQAWGSIAKSDEFVSNTERFAGELREDGIRHGELLGYPVLRSNTGVLGDDEAYLVDRGVYGWESPRDEFDVNRWRDDDQRCFFYGLNGRIDWVPTDTDAAIKALGGA